jgi:glutamyl/glutaminyl-tRNA synthetase
MSKLTDLLSKGARLIVTDTGDSSSGEVPEAPSPREREIAPELVEAPPPRAVSRSAVSAAVEDFSAVYDEAGIQAPDHGYGIDKVAEMLEGKRLAPLAREVRATAVMAAMEAAGAPIRDAIQDAVLRDKALDAFEVAKERELQETRAKNQARIQELTAEMDSLLKKINTEIERLKQEGEAASQAFAALQVRKRREEERLRDVVAHFIEGGDNPITTSPLRGASPPPPPKPEKPS